MKKLLLTIATLMTYSQVVSAGVVYSEMHAEEGASIQGECSEKIGRGGNYFQGKVKLSGKCHGAVLPPEIQGPRNFLKYVSFKTDPTIDNGVNSGNDRTELAHTKDFFPFGHTVYIGFRMRIPKGVNITENFFQPLQLWQCSPRSPIGGLRIQRGTSHTVQFMTRGDLQDSTKGSVTFTPGKWHDVVLSVNASPVGPSSFVARVDGVIIANSTAPFGYNRSGACDGASTPPQGFRVKFGIYKTHEPKKKFEVHFDDFRITEYYSMAKPY